MNPHIYVVSLNDGVFKGVHEADWLIPDGAGVVLASKILGGQIRERVTGSDIFKGVLEALDRKGGHSVFFLGATEETLAVIRARMAVDYPNVRVAGTYSPPFKPQYSRDELDAMVAAINEAAPDVLWVGMTAPKQEKWIHAECGRLNVKFVAAVGAVFDFYMGSETRQSSAPTAGSRVVCRSVQEPRRLWRRHYVNAPIFVGHVLKAAVKRRLG